VLRTDRAANAVVVGPRDSLATTHVEARGRLYLPVDKAAVKLRHRATPVEATVAETEEGFTLELEEPAQAVATGQLAALYDQGAVVGAGVVTRVA
jgi:tRNA U34 2-thiouridine synthase MnmA/TrmU